MLVLLLVRRIGDGVQPPSGPRVDALAREREPVTQRLLVHAKLEGGSADAALLLDDRLDVLGRAAGDALPPDPLALPAGTLDARLDACDQLLTLRLGEPRHDRDQ